MTSVVQIAVVRAGATLAIDTPLAQLGAVEASEVKTTNGAAQSYTLDVPSDPALYVARVAVAGDVGVYVTATASAAASATNALACPAGGVYEFSLAGMTAGWAFRILDIT